jgi:hypothetical protein
MVQGPPPGVRRQVAGAANLLMRLTKLRRRATRMGFEVRERTGERRGAIARVVEQLGIYREASRG